MSNYAGASLEVPIQKIATPPDQLQVRYDAIVVGSGYGGGVAACRLARAGKSVAVLERGREWPIGSFPKSGVELAKAFRASAAKFAVGDDAALFDYRINDDVDVLMGSGLGGTSLINANVCLKPDPRVFDDDTWPEEFRNDGYLAEGFARARSVLRPRSVAAEHELQKLDALSYSAAELGAKARRIPVHVSFEDAENYAGVAQPACTLCGDCCGGCNVGAKSTTAQTYLSDAVRHGAKIFTRVFVRVIARNNDLGWILKGEKGKEKEPIAISAPIVVLAAGTLGSTEILLRSRDEGLAVSDALGRRFTANGDSLSIAYNGEVPCNNIGIGHPPKERTTAVGPAVAGLIDMRSNCPLDDGIAVVEASLPSSMAAMIPAILASGNLPFGTDTDKGFADGVGEFFRSIESLVGGAYLGASYHTQTLLGIGHDAGNGELVLDNDSIRIVWPDAGLQPIFQRLNEVFETAASAIGASLLRNPFSLPGLGSKITTVHPLGGCVMGDSRETAVVDHKCRVFDSTATNGPSSVHDGLYVCDGSVIARSLGIHPLFTITAVAERAMIHLAADYGLRAMSNKSNAVQQRETA